MSENDLVIVPNIALISGIPNAKSLGFLGELGYKSILASTKPKSFQSLSILKYFLGYNDNFLNLISKLKWDFTPEDVGILAPRRGVTKKSLTVFSGTENVNDVGRVYAINNQTKLNVWKTDECNEVTGSDGVIYGPELVQHKKDLLVYLPNFGRSLPLVFDKEVKIMNGMRSYRYKAPYGTFSSRETYPDNKYYCELKKSSGKHIDGLLDVSDTIDGSPPIYISHPHFMEGDLRLFEYFEGLQPNTSLHESFAYIHPRLSVPLHGVSRMQINVKVNHFGGYYKKLSDGVILPLAWIETTTDEFPDSILMRLFLSTIVVDFIEITLKILSLLVLTLSLFYFIVNFTRNFKNVTILSHQPHKSPF